MMSKERKIKIMKVTYIVKLNKNYSDEFDNRLMKKQRDTYYLQFFIIYLPIKILRIRYKPAN